MVNENVELMLWVGLEFGDDFYQVVDVIEMFDDDIFDLQVCFLYCCDEFSVVLVFDIDLVGLGYLGMCVWYCD